METILPTVHGVKVAPCILVVRICFVYICAIATCAIDIARGHGDVVFRLVKYGHFTDAVHVYGAVRNVADIIIHGVGGKEASVAVRLCALELDIHVLANCRP